MAGIRKDVLTFMPLNCNWSQDLMDNVHKTCLSKGPLKGWVPMKIHIVDNPDLEEAFEDRKESLRKMGRTEEELKEEYCFVAESWKAVVSMCKYGIRCSVKKTNILGDTRAGIHLNRNYDMLLKFMSFRNFITARCIVVLKVMPGRTKRVMPRFKGRTLLHPSKHYDSHISVIDADPNIPINEGLANNFIYIYQLEEDSRVPLQHPRQAVPYAVIQVRQPFRCSVGRPFTSFRDRILAQIKNKDSKDSTRRRSSMRDFKISSQGHSRRSRSSRSRSCSNERTGSHSKGRSRGRSRNRSKTRSSSKGKRSQSGDRTSERSNEKPETSSVRENDPISRKRGPLDDNADESPTSKKSKTPVKELPTQESDLEVLDDKKSSIQTKLQQIEEEIRLRQSKLTELRCLQSNQENSQSSGTDSLSIIQSQETAQADLQPENENYRFSPKISCVCSTSEHFPMDETVSNRELSSGASTPTLDEPHYNNQKLNFDKEKTSRLIKTEHIVVPPSKMDNLRSNLVELTPSCDVKNVCNSSLVGEQEQSKQEVKTTDAVKNEPIENVESPSVNDSKENINKRVKIDKEDLAKDPDIRTLFTEAIYKMDPSELYELLTAKLSESDEVIQDQTEEKVCEDNSSDIISSDDIGVLDLSCRTKEDDHTSKTDIKPSSHLKTPNENDSSKGSDIKSIQIGEHSYSVNSSFFLDNLDILASVASEIQAAKADVKNISSSKHPTLKGIAERSGEQEYIFNAEDFHPLQIVDGETKICTNSKGTTKRELKGSGKIVTIGGETFSGRGRSRAKHVNNSRRKSDSNNSSGLLKELSSLMCSGIPSDIISTRRRTANSVSAALSASEQSNSDNTKPSSSPKTVISLKRESTIKYESLSDGKQNGTCLGLSTDKNDDNSKNIETADKRYNCRENLFEKFKSADDIEKIPNVLVTISNASANENMIVKNKLIEIDANVAIRSSDCYQIPEIKLEPENHVLLEENIKTHIGPIKTEPLDETFIGTLKDTISGESRHEGNSKITESVDKQLNVSQQVDLCVTSVIKTEPGLTVANEDSVREKDSTHDKGIVETFSEVKSNHRTSIPVKSATFTNTQPEVEVTYKAENTPPVFGKTTECENTTVWIKDNTGAEHTTSVIKETAETENATLAIGKTSGSENTILVIEKTTGSNNTTPVIKEKPETKNTTLGIDKTTGTEKASPVIEKTTETGKTSNVIETTVPEANKSNTSVDLDDSIVDIMDKQVTESMKQSHVPMPIVPIIKQEPSSPKQPFEEENSSLISKSVKDELVRVKVEPLSPGENSECHLIPELSSQRNSSDELMKISDGQNQLDFDNSDSPILITSEINKTIKDLEHVIDLFSEKVKHTSVDNELNHNSERNTTFERNDSISKHNEISVPARTHVRTVRNVERASHVLYDTTVGDTQFKSADMNIQVITGIGSSRNTALNSSEEATTKNISKGSISKSSSLVKKATASKSKLSRSSRLKKCSERAIDKNKTELVNKTNDAARTARVLKAAFKESTSKDDTVTVIKKEPITEDEYYGVSSTKLSTKQHHVVTQKNSSKEKMEKKQSGLIGKQETKKGAQDSAYSAETSSCKDSRATREGGRRKQKSSEKANANITSDFISDCDPLEAIRTSYSSSSRENESHRKRTLFIEDGKCSRSEKSKQRRVRKSRSKSSDSSLLSSDESPVSGNTKYDKRYSSNEAIRKRQNSRSPDVEEGRWYVKSKWDANDSPKSGTTYSPSNRKTLEGGNSNVMMKQKKSNSIGLLGHRPSNCIGGRIHDQDAFFSSTGYSETNRKFSSAQPTKYTTSYTNDPYTINRNNTLNVSQSSSSSTLSSRNQHNSYDQHGYSEVIIKRERSSSLDRDKNAGYKRVRSSSRERRYNRSSRSDSRNKEFSSGFKRLRNDDRDHNSYYRKRGGSRSRDRDSSSSTDRSFTPQRSSGSYRKDSSSCRDFRDDHYSSNSSHYQSSNRITNESTSGEHLSGRQGSETEINNTLSKAMSTLLKKIIFDDQTSDNSKEGRMAEMVLDMVKARVVEEKSQSRRNEDDMGSGSRSVFRDQRRVSPDRSVTRERRNSPERSSSRPYNSGTSRNTRSTIYKPYDKSSSKLSPLSSRETYRDDYRPSVSSTVRRVDQNSSCIGNETSYTTSYHKDFNTQYNTVRRPWNNNLRRGISSARRTWSRGISSLSYSSRSHVTRSSYKGDSSRASSSKHSERESRISTRDRRSQSK